jgi:hypothetical protein
VISAECVINQFNSTDPLRSGIDIRWNMVRSSMVRLDWRQLFGGRHGDAIFPALLNGSSVSADIIGIES